MLSININGRSLLLSLWNTYEDLNSRPLPTNRTIKFQLMNQARRTSTKLNLLVQHTNDGIAKSLCGLQDAYDQYV
jgi:hypothetical protein